MMKKPYTLILIISLILTACEKVVDSDKLLDTEEKVFINGYIAPTDTLLRISVSKALPAIGTPLNLNDKEANENLFLIKNAIVSLSDSEGNSADLLYSEEQSAYLTDAVNLPVVDGRSYFLKVTVNGEEFNSSCQIPKRIDTIIETVTNKKDEFDNNYADLNVGFRDFEGSKNYYIIGAFTEFNFEEEVIKEPLFFESDGFLTDAIEDGLLLGDRTNVFLDVGEDFLPRKVTIQVAHVSEILYQNLKASDQNSENDGNPFVEYSIAPDNIEQENGVGVFAGYNITEKILEIDK